MLVFIYTGNTKHVVNWSAGYCVKTHPVNITYVAVWVYLEQRDLRSSLPEAAQHNALPDPQMHQCEACLSRSRRAYHLKDCVQETNFTVKQSNACNKCCLCFCHSKCLVRDERCYPENSVDRITMPFCSSSWGFCLLSCLYTSETLPDMRKRKLCLVLSLVCGLPADTFMKKPVMLILMLALFSVVWMLYCP